MTGSLPGEMTGDFSQLLLGICAGALLAMAAAMLRARRQAARWTGFAFFLTSALFAVRLWNDQAGALTPELQALVNILATTSVGWFWLMVMALFGDLDRYRPAMFIAPPAMGLCAIANMFNLGSLAPLTWALTMGLESALTIWSIVIVLRSWKDDLVESRRRLRGPFMVAVGFYILSLSGFDAWAMLGTVPEWYPMFNASLLASVVLGGAFMFLDPREAMFGAEAQPVELRLAAQPPLGAVGEAINQNSLTRANGHALGQPKTPDASSALLDRAARADLERLEFLMAREQVWKEEGLTIASLALRASMPETQLRRLINDCLGYRNFPSYVNAHRIAAAKSRLSDPGEARVSISTIAFDIGFASLGPFNRAFKEEAGVSPSEWRRKALEFDSPISEHA